MPISDVCRRPILAAPRQPRAVERRRSGLSGPARAARTRGRPARPRAVAARMITTRIAITYAREGTGARRARRARRRAQTDRTIACRGRDGVQNAARAAIVICQPSLAFADKVVEQPQVSLFAAFGSFAMLVLVEFAGSPRTRSGGISRAGAASAPHSSRSGRSARGTPWLAAGAMAVVGFGDALLRA